MSDYIELNRSFWPIEADKENSPENIRVMLAFGVARQTLWEDLLEKPRVVILAEPGTGKTEELRAVTKRLRATGKPAFFCKIELLQSQSLDVKQAFDIGTSTEFVNWLTGDQEGYFFLDSVDEARLNSHTAFEIALKRFAGIIGERLNQAKIIVTCRVSDWQATADPAMFLDHLPIPESNTIQQVDKTSKESGQVFGDSDFEDESSGGKEKNDHIVFQLKPLNQQQIRRFAAEKGVNDTNAFIEAIERADALIFAERPQDLLELISFWNSNGRLGRHTEMIDFNIQTKLVEHDPDRDKRKPISADDAILGAERFAAAITLQKKNSIILPDRHIDMARREVSINPKEILPDWSPDKIQTLLDRAIFDEAIYGTVQFHHRTVREYLTARWFKRLLDKGKSRRLIDGLLFANQYGRDVVIPSMRPIIAWLSIWDDRVRNRVRTIAPEVLIENGDPSTLPIEFRKSLLIGFAEHYASRQHTGTSFDIMMIRRLADSQLASTVNDLLKKFATHDDVCKLLLKIIWQGQISDSADVALCCAMDDQVDSYKRIYAIRAVAVAGTYEQHRNLINALMTNLSRLDSRIRSEICNMFFPNILTVEQLIEIIKTAEPPHLYSSSPLERSLDEISSISLPDEVIEQLLREFYKLIKSPPFIERIYCEFSGRHAWLLPSAIELANQFIQKEHLFSFDTIVLDLFQAFLIAQGYHNFFSSNKKDNLKTARAWPEFRIQLFWHATAILRAKEKDNNKQITDWWQVRFSIRDFWVPSAVDLKQLFEDLTHKPLIDDRLIALTAIFTIYIQEKRPRQVRELMKKTVLGFPELETKLKQLTYEQKKWCRQERVLKRKQNSLNNPQEVIQQEWRQKIKSKPEDIKNVGDAKKGQIWQRTTHLYDRMQEKKDKDRLGRSNWRVLIDEFGYDVAKNFRDGCVAYWRDYDPFTYSNRRVDNTTPWSCKIGLTGIAMEAADNSEWTKHISNNEAKIAAHYSVCELYGFPDWFKEFLNDFPDLIDTIIIDELRWELHEGSVGKISSRILSALIYSEGELQKRYKSVIFDLLIEQEPASDDVLDDALSIVLEGNLDLSYKEKVAKLAWERFEKTSEKNRKITWLIVLLNIDGFKGFELLKQWITHFSSLEEQKKMMIKFCATLIDDGGVRFSRVIHDYKRIEILSEFVLFIYQFVKREEDAHHDGAYSPDIRDNAEQTRSQLLSIIVDTPGRLSYDALVKLSKSINNQYSKDRMDYLAKERAALDAEFEPWPGAAVAEFSISVNRQPRTQADLYELALVQLDELKDDIEDGDESEAVLLQKLTKEIEVRIMFANRLRKSAFSLYTVGSEEELADAKRTDIRINAPQVSAPVPIELKIADKLTLNELCERLENQLIGQYMRISQYGIFLVVHNGTRKHWEDTQAGKKLTFLELIEKLKQDAAELIRKHSNVTALEVVGIDFTVRSVRKIERCSSIEHI